MSPQSNPEPTVRQYMTAHPHTIAREQSMLAARTLMEQKHIRHLPVLHDGALVGLISERDIGLVESLANLGLEGITVEDAMSPYPYSVAPDTPLREVVSRMADQKLGSAVVVDGGAPCGIFTALDAYRALVDLLSDPD